MEILSAAGGYIMKAFSQNKEVKEFENEFIGAFIDWVRPWFLEDDPSANVVLEMEGVEEAKKSIIDAKLPELLKDDSFKSELETWMQKIQAAEPRVKNIVKDVEVETEDFHVGDKNASSDENLSQKNIVEKAKVKAKNFRVGDD